MPDYKNYPRDVLASCEAELQRQHIPKWFIARFAVADETRPDMWGSVRSIGYQWPQPIIREDDGYLRPVDISGSINEDVWQLLELAAVARAWLACFGERSPWELALAYEFAHLDARRTQKWITSDQAADKGRKSGVKRRKALSTRDQQIVFDAMELLDSDTPQHKLVSELADDEAYKNPLTGKPLTKRRLRNILTNAGIMHPKTRK